MTRSARTIASAASPWSALKGSAARLRWVIAFYLGTAVFLIVTAWKVNGAFAIVSATSLLALALISVLLFKHERARDILIMVLVTMFVTATTLLLIDQGYLEVARVASKVPETTLPTGDVAQMPTGHEDSSTTWLPLFLRAKVEVIVLITVCLAIIGCLYAVWAKWRADDVFDQNEVIITAIGGVFTEGDALFEEGSPRSLISLINSTGDSLKLALGSPLVGYFRSPRLGRKFADALEDLSAKGKGVEMMCWNDATIRKYLTEMHDPESEENFRHRFHELERSLNGAANACAPTAGRSRVHRWELPDFGVRFAIRDDEQVIVWFIANPSVEGASQEKKKSEYIAGGFSTTDRKMVAIFCKLWKQLLCCIQPPPA